MREKSSATCTGINFILSIFFTSYSYILFLSFICFSSKSVEDMNSQLNVAVRKNEQDDDVTILRTEDSYLRKCFNDRKAFNSEAIYSFKTVL